MASAPSTIGFVSPGVQFQMDRPIAAPNTAIVISGINARCTKRDRSRLTMRITSDPPAIANSGASPW